jgi:ABC-type sugar transport system substrate-binding protein
MVGLRNVLLAAAAVVAMAQGAGAFELGVIGFQFSSETHARVANAAAAAAKAKGWNVTLLNSEGALPKHAEQFDALIAKKVDAIIIAMGKPVEADAQFKAAKDAKIPVITVQSGASPHALFDIQTNEYKVGAEAALYLLGQLGYQGNIVTARFDLNVASRIRGKLLDAVLSENQAVKELGKFSMARTQSWRDDVRAGMQALLLQNQGKINGIWASFDGQAYIIDDLLQAQGREEGPKSRWSRSMAARRPMPASPTPLRPSPRPSRSRSRRWASRRSTRSRRSSSTRSRKRRSLRAPISSPTPCWSTRTMSSSS